MTSCLTCDVRNSLDTHVQSRTLFKELVKYSGGCSSLKHGLRRNGSIVNCPLLKAIVLGYASWLSTRDRTRRVRNEGQAGTTQFRHRIAHPDVEQDPEASCQITMKRQKPITELSRESATTGQRKSWLANPMRSVADSWSSWSLLFVSTTGLRRDLHFHF